jgi:hypothetical protein
MSTIKNIFVGWANFLKDRVGVLPPNIKMEAERRLEICATCPHRKGQNCGLCGCFLPAKATTESPCPAGKWDKTNINTIDWRRFV